MVLTNAALSQQVNRAWVRAFKLSYGPPVRTDIKKTLNVGTQ